MRIAFSRLVHAAAESLRDSVIPTISDDYARGQVYAVINLLNTLELRGDWSAALPLSQIALQNEAMDRLSKIMSRYGEAANDANWQGGSSVSIDDLLARVEEGNRKVVALLAWAERQRSVMSEVDFLTVQEVLMDLMKALNEKEWRHVGPQMLALIAGSSQS
jgi:hypothetical protein